MKHVNIEILNTGETALKIMLLALLCVSGYARLLLLLAPHKGPVVLPP